MGVFLGIGWAAARGAPGAPCESAQALEKAQNQWAAIGNSWDGFGFGATSAWVWRHVRLGLAPCGLGIDGPLRAGQCGWPRAEADRATAARVQGADDRRRSPLRRAERR